GLTGLALIAGPVVGGADEDGSAWRGLVWINVPVGIAAIALVRGRVPESFGSGAAIDMLGVTLVTSAALGVVWALMRGNNAGWTSPEVTGALVLGALLAVCLHFLGAARPRADGADAIVSRARFRIGQRGVFPVHGVALRHRVLHGAVFANRAGSWTARRRATTFALDCHPVRGGAAFRRARQPDRRAHPHR